MDVTCYIRSDPATEAALMDAWISKSRTPAYTHFEGLSAASVRTEALACWRDRHICYIPTGKPVTFPDLDHFWECHRFTDQPTGLGKPVTFHADPG